MTVTLKEPSESFSNMSLSVSSVMPSAQSMFTDQTRPLTFSVTERNVHAKTGTVDKARSLSGYVTTADGRALLFSFLCNNFSVPSREVDRVTDAILVRLAGMPLGTR